ncbi:putative chloroplast enhancing stress tolerance protein [Arabidopsis thaliana]
MNVLTIFFYIPTTYISILSIFFSRKIINPFSKSNLVFFVDIMPPPAMLAFDDGLARKSNDNEWQGFRVFPGENTNPNPNINFLVKKAILQNEKSISPLFSRSSATDDSFRIVLPPALPPPRDSTVPLPMLPEPIRARKKLSHQESVIFMNKSRFAEKILYKDEDFKCNAFCLSLPGFGKNKLVRSSSKRHNSMEKKMIRASSFTGATVSVRASLEKFECGSWASTTALIQDNGGNGGRDVQEPVTSGFLFDRETETLALRSVLKTRSTRDHRRSAESSPQRRVRFSTSSSSASVSCPTSPRTCITPRLRKARDDFNTFLTAQNA